MTNSLWKGVPALGEELGRLEELLRREFGGAGFLRAASSQLVLGGGKRLRPALVIASAHVGAYDRERTLPVAAALEALHTASLVHDDVIDGADTRRGMPTLHRSHGNHVAIYAGDFLLAKAMLLVSRSGLPGGELKRLACAMEAMCSGEVAQYQGRNRIPGYREYLKRIMGKTGVLFAGACAAGGRCAGLNDSTVTLLWRFGLRLGAAFQIRDDLIDIRDGESGKPTGRDLMDGIVTLPILLAAADGGYRLALSRFLQNGRNPAEAAELVAMAHSLGAPGQAERMLAAEIDRSLTMLDALPDGPGRLMLREIASSLL